MLLGLLATTAAVAVAALAICRLVLFRQQRSSVDSKNTLPTLGIFHPYCNAGGGGERVLWVAIQALERLCVNGATLRAVIYTGDDDATPQAILDKALNRFHVDLRNSKVQVSFVYVKHRNLMSATRWPRFTMLGQSLGSMIVAWHGLRQYRPDVFLDTTGCAFTYFIAKVCAGVPVATYTHYPTITSDMLQRVYDRRPTYNNDASISSSQLATLAKVVYYRLFAVLYRWVGRLADVVMVNSNWTKAHLDTLWSLRGNRQAMVVFPPCNTAEFETLPLGNRSRTVVSVAQFRPEKDHRKQVQAFALLKQEDVAAYKDVELVLLGGARDDEDIARVNELKKLAHDLGVDSSVRFLVNMPFSRLREELGRSLIGLHTMWCEHFGIGVVEMMAAGVATIAHRSGGPSTDIVVPFHGGSTGWLADSAEEYAAAMAEVLHANPGTLQAITARARASVARFSDEEFAGGFAKAMQRLLVAKA